MYAAVLHTFGTVPRYEEFPEPVIGDKDGEAIVHVHAASLKPVDKQLASGSHYASRRELPCVCGSDGVGHLDDGQRVFFGRPRSPHSPDDCVKCDGRREIALTVQFGRTKPRPSHRCCDSVALSDSLMDLLGCLTGRGP